MERFMKRQLLLKIFLGVIIMISSTINFAQSEKGFEVVNLRTEYNTNPIGIDITIPRFSWELRSDIEKTMQSKFELVFALSEENLNNENYLWDLMEESDRSVHIEYKGPELSSRQRVYWKVRVTDNHKRTSDWSEISYWEMGLLNETDWSAEWVEADVIEDTLKSEPSQYFRKEFETNGKVKSARLYITSHGLYECLLNGEKVGDEVFTPGWTSYNKRLQYQTYDVTKLISDSENAIGVVLGDGWYRGFLAWKDQRNVYGQTLGLLAQLEIIFEDGSKQNIYSDESWKATNAGPILSSDIYMGESYDAGRELDNWNEVGFNDSNWKNTIQKDHSKKYLIAPQGPPVRKVEELKPIKIIKKKDDKYIFDIGQNMVGWIRLKVSGETGRKVTLRHAEVLDKYGEFYTENLRIAKQEINYTLKGNGPEVFEPHFTFQGFRYVEVSGFPGEPTLDAITGIVIHSDMTPIGNFECSNPLINQLQHNIVWGLKGNFLDVPTDCPQRDERLGWTGDAQVFAPTACFNMDAATFYTKWMKDLAADQGEDGSVNDVIPDVLNGGGGHTGWADAATVIPWTVYLKFGDVRILEEQYESMKAWVEFMADKAGESYLWTGDWHYGDWLAYASTSSAYMGAYTETDLIASAYFAYSSTLLAKSAKIIGKAEDAKIYLQLAQKIKDAFYKEFVTPNGRLVSNTQTAYTLALALDILPDSIKPKAAKYLADDVERFKHITTGFLGTPLISKTLTEFGYLDLAYMLLNREEYPSWLYPVTMGATTIWERWDGIKPDSSFQNKGMNSFNHYAYGAIGEWLYSTVAGISLDEDNPGYKSIIIDANPGGELTHANASLSTVYGDVSSAWEYSGDKFIHDIIIPANTNAIVYFPSEKKKSITINGKNLEKENIGNNGIKSTISLGSGTYRIEY